MAERGGVKIAGGARRRRRIREGKRKIDSPKRGSGTTCADAAARMPDKQSANLIATGSTAQRVTYIECLMDPELSCSLAKRQTAKPIERLRNCLNLPVATEESSFFEDECTTNQLTLQPYQQAQASLSTGAGGFGLSVAQGRNMSASVVTLVATVPEIPKPVQG